MNHLYVKKKIIWMYRRLNYWSLNKRLYHEINIKLYWERLYHTPSVKYLGVKNDENLNWHNHINDPAAKLNWVNALLLKIRNYANQKILKSIYFGIFYSHLNYANLKWAQNSNAIQQIIILPKKPSEWYHFSLETLIKVLFCRKIIF